MESSAGFAPLSASEVGLADEDAAPPGLTVNQATRRPLTGGGRVVVVVRGTKGSILAQACCCLFFIVRTFTRASFAQRVAFVVMLCQFRIDEFVAAARGISGRSHRMAARRRRMVRNGSPTGRFARGAVDFVS